MTGRSAAPSVLIGGAFIAVLAFASPSPRWIWNATASAPEGLYGLQRGGPWGRHDLVAIRPPAEVAAWLNVRGYAPSGVLLIKQVAAVAPSTVCRHGAVITIDQIQAAQAETYDHAGRPLPVWSGCRALTANEVFLLNPAKGSLDSRYLGPLPRASVIGRVAPIWLIADIRHAP